ncbi:PREDICTED: pecanex-like protein 1 [Papilio polytes]|uniref:pecanex-like protein 1 n=1 Tax=Papilio polytes TaxID=76194 RepID=UPI00067637A8|nr:PREDICTED: pecanex-like protein 1 [Papilio polytes]
MGSQTLEILRQGVWASLTGGWFYDPHQNLFCNTVHLYIWLFLLCLPFSVYLYFPPASVGWIIYCALVAILFTCLKLLNHGLHHMYDTKECIVVQPTGDPANPYAGSTQEEGMEMMRLGVALGSALENDNESATSLEYHKPNNSTIDLKVDVHRKNSSESSMEDSAMSLKPPEAVAMTKSDLCVTQTETPGPSKARPNNRIRCAHKREHRTKTRRTHANRIDELIVEEASRNQMYVNNHPVHVLSEDGTFAKVSRRYHECPHRRGSNSRDLFKEWLYLDTRENGDPYNQHVARQLSSDSRDNSEPSVGPPSPKKRTAHRRRYNNYPDESCSKSAMALATQPSNMRRNSNSTMSTIQLPLLNSTAQLVSHMRRHSNNADTGFFASVELGEYMMVKAEPPACEAEKSKGKSPGVRRIKSAALEIGCPPPSVSNLSPHPNSAETIGGQVLKNPKNAVIPPPSKSLTRGPHLNLYPKNESGEGCSYPYLTYGSEIVYPIAEISDEMQTSQKETDLDSSGDSYSDYEDEKQFRGFDWDAEQSPAARSSDSDYENNGSRSPLLDRATDVRIVRSKHHGDSKKPCCDRHSSTKHSAECPNDKMKHVRLKKLSKNEHFESKRPDKQAACECKYNPNGDYFDKASASSKDLLIEKSSLESNDNAEQDKKPEDKKVAEKKLWDHDISNSSSSSENNLDKLRIDNKYEKNPAPETEESQLTCDSKSADERSVYSLDWLFEETPESTLACKEDAACAVQGDTQKCAALGESSSNVPRNLGAIPKQIKNLARSRASSQKENKKRDSRREREDSQNEDRILLDAVEAQAALVQGLECLFAATNANTVVMPAPSREDRSRSHRQSIRGERESANKTRKRSIEEVAQTSTNTLLPTSMPLLAAFLNSRVDFIPCCANENPPAELVQYSEEGQRLRPLMDRNHRNRVRKIKRSTRQRNNPAVQNSSEKKDKPPSTENPNSSSNVHFATSFDDTSDGAIHKFMDEYGNWMSYTFDKNANAPSLMPSIGEETVDLNIRNKFSKLMDEIEKANQPKPKSYYKFKLSKCLEIKITMDRLKLLALFDRNLTFRETFVSIMLAITVAVLGSMVLNLGFYKDIYAFWFCFIMAGSQYSLLKSVQPDSASPVHGFNKMVVFSRPVYFCICTAILCGVHNQLEQITPADENFRSRRSIDDIKPLTVYGFEFHERDFLYVIQEIISKFLLFFPLAFSLGLFPQVNTFLMYLLEQIDMHVFGGNATSSLSAALYCVVRSLAAVGVLYGFAYSGLIEGKKSQHQKHNILFSIFCGLLVPIAYHLSRSASDYTLIWNLIKKHLLPPELYVIQNPDCTPELEKTEPNPLSEDKKNDSESNISKQNSIGSSASKINFSSETNIAKSQKRSQASSVSSLKMDPKGDVNSTNSLKLDPPTETEDKSRDTTTNNSTANKQDIPDKTDEDMEDPLPGKLQATVNARLKNDVIVCTFLGLCVFGLHCTTVFTTLRPQLNTVLWIIAGCLGWMLHYVSSAIFMTSYVRPVKFWERDYNTKRVDQSNTRLSSQLERNLGADDNNLNSIFYEHLTRSLQHYLCGDLQLGRWGQVQQGDCFVLASDYLNCLVHIVEVGNGLVSFQLRGLEFRGTYCQQREVEAISEGPEESSEGVCGRWWCGGRVLAPGACWALRWLAWQLAAARYVLEGYSVSDNSAVSMLQVFDFRKVLLTYYVKSIIYYTIQSSKLEEWLSSPTIAEALKPMSERSFVDLDPIFNVNLDEDYDFRASGITRFQNIRTNPDKTFDHFMFPEEYCSAGALYAAISSHAQRLVICHEAAPAWRHNVLRGAPHLLALRHVMDEGNDDYKIIMLNKRFLGFRVIKLNRECVRGLWAGQQQELVYLRNRNPERGSIQNAKQALRNIINSSCDQPIGYPIYVSPLTTSYADSSPQLRTLLGGPVSVAGLRRRLADLWTRVRRRCGEGCSTYGSQDSTEARRRSEERGGRRERNMRARSQGSNSWECSWREPPRRAASAKVSSSQYGSAESSLEELALGGADTAPADCRPARGRHEHIARYFLNEGTSKDLSKLSKEIRHERESYRELTGRYIEKSEAIPLKETHYSDLSNKESILKKETKKDSKAKEIKTKIKRSDSGRSELKMNVSVGSKVLLVEPLGVYDCINLGRRIDVQWPSEAQRERGGRNFWGSWVPLAGMDGLVVHKWTPNHRDPKLRSHVDKTILLVQIDDKFVPIAENCVQDLGDEV